MPKQVYEVTVYEDGSEEWRLDGELHRDGDLPAVICADGSKYWYQHGKRHRLTGPAVEWADGDVMYWIEGERLPKGEFLRRTQCKKMTVAEIEEQLGHKVEVIAEESQDGYVLTFDDYGIKLRLNGELHSIHDHPAVIFLDGTRFWYKNGLLHRDNDQPAKILSNGTRSWYKNGKPNRLTGPAIERNDGQEYYYIEGRAFPNKQEFLRYKRSLRFQNR